AQGYTVYTAAVGPFSSNWDRACELYAQIKGGQVDYGTKHAAKHGHTRTGRTYAGLYPEWGNVVNGKVNKVHLIGHSMGGQTIRMLTQLLNKGSAGAPVVEDASSSALFAGGKDWVHSITTISTSNQGTTFANGISEIGDSVKNLLVGVLSVLNVGGSTAQMLYDAKLDQWGITAKRSGESLGDYMERVFSSPIFKPGFKDVSLWSLSTPGATEENTWVKTLPNVYYYSYATSDTFGARDWLLRAIQLPHPLTMLLPLQPLGVFLGSRYAPNAGFSTSWQENDGVVKDLYFAHAAVLASLPADGGKARALSAVAENATAADTHTLLGDIVTAVANNLVTASANLKTTDDLKVLCATPINEFAAAYCQNMLKAAAASTPSRRLRGY
ncbi:hypothetical protein PybrP1_000167, partial [[Pythium] brassicae (nom. inval.)]